MRTREFGRTLIKALIVKLKPYDKEGWQDLSRHDRTQHGGEFIWRATVAFETTVQPDIAKKIEEPVKAR